MKWAHNIRKERADYQIKLVQKDPFQLSELYNPSDEVIKAAVKKNYRCLKVLDSVSEDVAMYAINIHVAAIQHMPKQSDEIYLRAIAINPRALKYIQNPTHEMISSAIFYMPNLIGLVDKPTCEHQLSAVRKDPKTIESIKQPCAEAQKLVMSSHYGFLRHIHYPNIDSVIQYLIGWERHDTDLSKLINLKEKCPHFREDDWWEVVRHCPVAYRVMNLTPEQIAFARICS